MSEQNSVHKIIRLSEDLFDLEMKHNLGAHMGTRVLGFGRRPFKGSDIGVYARSNQMKGLIVEFLDGKRTTDARTFYHHNRHENTVGIDGPMRQVSGPTMHELAQTVGGITLPREIFGQDYAPASAEELDFVVSFFRNPNNRLVTFAWEGQPGKPVTGLRTFELHPSYTIPMS